MSMKVPITNRPAMAAKLANTQDVRALRTRQGIREAFLALLAEQSFEQVTVSEIAARAQVNRVTFYKHFIDKWDLLSSWITEARKLLDDKASSLHNLAVLSTAGHVPELVFHIFGLIYEQRAYYRLMIGRTPLAIIADQLEKQMESFIREQLEVYLQLDPAMPPDMPPLSLLCRAEAASFVGVVRWWLENDCQPPVAQMARWTWQTPDTLSGFLAMPPAPANTDCQQA
jgi:AcrR family transcriptional regulator